MNSKDYRNIREAYLDVYKNEQSNEKEVEIASHYFCEMGLNEIGVEILIEELGVEEFAEFVYDISEEYYLTEARAGGVMIKPVTTKGTPFKGGKPTGKSLERLRKEKEKRKETEASERPSGMKAALKRQDAMVSASKQQPKKKGFLDRVAGAVLKGIERHKAATSGMGASTKVTAGKVGNAARAFAKGFTEETDLYDIILSHLIGEGYADTEQAAEAIMVNMSEEWRESIVEAFVDPENDTLPSGETPLQKVSGHPNPMVRKKAVKAMAKQMGKEYGGNFKTKSKDPAGDD